MYVRRRIEKIIKDASKTFPAIVISGPRQSGKTTLLTNCVPNGTFITLDNLNFRSLLLENPIEYLESQEPPVIIDEIQYLPEIVAYIKILIDRNRSPGNWYITGSQKCSAMKNISVSLAGRADVLSLPPFNLAERPEQKDLVPYLLSSSYPEPLLN